VGEEGMGVGGGGLPGERGGVVNCEV